MDKQANIHMPYANMNCQRVEESFVPVVEGEAIKVENFLAEPKNDFVTVDSILCLDEDGQMKCSGTDNFSAGLDAIMMKKGQDELDFGILDGILDEVDEIDDLHAVDGLSSPYENFLLDIDLAEVVKLDFSPFEGSHLDKLSSESNSPGSDRSSSGAVALGKSTAKVECYNHVHDQTALYMPRGVCQENRYLSYPVEEMQTFDSQAPDDMENDSDHFASGVTIVIRSLDRATESTLLCRQKRNRNPTRRFIEESSASKSRSSRGKQKDPIITLKEKLMNSRPHDDDHTSVKKLTSIGVSGTQVASEFRPRRGRPKKQAVVLEPKSNKDISDAKSEKDSSGTESEDRYMRNKRFKRTNDRRQQQRIWTLAEVMILIDGIAQYGVGRWTDIKRHLFSSSPYRTPTDIRDKWRNLLKASCELKKGQKGVEVEKKNALPNSVRCRIAQLANIHPYPRDSRTKLTRSRPLTAPTNADASEGSQSSFG